jgi:hypothetical protein
MSRFTARLAAAMLALSVLAGSPAAANAAASPPRGRPTVVLDRLEVPADVPQLYQRHLRHALKRLARRAEWGAGRGSRIEYRFRVERLEVSHQGSVVRVTCTALGRLPRGRSARSHLVFSGDANKRDAVVQRVLEIVARGVVTRLAELEAERRKSR